MKKVTINFLIERDGEEIELDVTGSISPPVRERTNCLPENAVPGEPGSAEIDKIQLDGKPWAGELTEEERERAELQLYCWFENEDEEGYDEDDDRSEDEPDLERDEDY